MKISELSRNIGNMGNLETTASKQKEEDVNASQAASTAAQSSEKVELSNRSVEYSKAAEKMEEVSKDRTDKVESLKMQVSNGTYSVDSRKVAEKMISDTLFNAVAP
jgi:negative regulator of flagellin synthesis FlgM